MKKSIKKYTLYISVFTILIGGCGKTEKFIRSFESAELKLCEPWILQNASKNGIAYPADSLCYFGLYSSEDVRFDVRGEIEIICYRLIPDRPVSTHYNGRPLIGTWALANHKKDIIITLTDSMSTLTGTPGTPITPQIRTWEILKLSSKELKVQEARDNGVYVYSFVLPPK